MAGDVDRPARTLPLLLAACLVGCGDSFPEEGPATVTRDSAGVTITEVRPGAWPDAPVVEVEGPPNLELGARSAASDRQFHRIRGAVLLADTLVAVADGGSGELRFFRSDGTRHWTLGGEGEGPEEFRALAGIIQLPARADAADRVAAYDFFGQRISVVDPARRGLVQTLSPTGLSPGTNLQGAFGEEAFLMRSEETRRPDESGGVIRTRVHFIRVPTQTPDRADTVATLPGPPRAVRQGVIVPMPFSAAPRARPAGDSLFVLVADGAGEVGVLDGVGRLARRIRAGRTGRAVTDSVLESYVAARTTGGDSVRARAELREWVSGLELPDRAVAYDALEISGCGDLWLRRYSPGRPDEERWDVMERSGRPLARVSLPPGFELTDAACGSVLGIWRDELGVEHVRRYPLGGPLASAAGGVP